MVTTAGERSQSHMVSTMVGFNAVIRNDEERDEEGFGINDKDSDAEDDDDEKE